MKLETARKHDWKVYPSNFWIGMEEGVNLCCILYFQYPHLIMRYAVPEYYEKMVELTNNAGIIPCPEYLIKTLLKKKVKPDNFWYR